MHPVAQIMAEAADRLLLDGSPAAGVRSRAREGLDVRLESLRPDRLLTITGWSRERDGDPVRREALVARTADGYVLSLLSGPSEGEHLACASVDEAVSRVLRWCGLGLSARGVAVSRGGGGG